LALVVNTAIPVEFPIIGKYVLSEQPNLTPVKGITVEPTAGFPKKPDGSTMKYRAAIKVGVIFTDSRNKARAKEFVSFLLQEENLQPYVEGALGRWFPVTTAGQKSPFWQADRHRKAVYNQFMDGTVPFEFTKNYKFTILNNENIWAKAMNRVVSEKVPVDKAVDEMIARIKQVAG